MPADKSRIELHLSSEDANSLVKKAKKIGAFMKRKPMLEQMASLLATARDIKNQAGLQSILENVVKSHNITHKGVDDGLQVVDFFGILIIYKSKKK